MPRLAVVDPDLTRDLPPDVTAATGMDAMTRLLEAFVSAKANPLTDGICREGPKRAARWLRRACERGEDVRARESKALASLFGGLALANAKLGGPRLCRVGATGLWEPICAGMGSWRRWPKIR